MARKGVGAGFTKHLESLADGFISHSVTRKESVAWGGWDRLPEELG